VPRGSGSAGLGGAVPLRGGVVIDLSRMDKVVSVDGGTGRVRVEPGCTWDRLREAITSENLGLRTYPLNAGGATVGGWISTGGYGVGTIADGRFDTALESLEVAAPSGLLVNAAHGGGRYSIESFTGTEGQLGIITGVTLSLKKRPQRRVHHVMGPVTAGDGVEALRGLAGLDDPPLGLRLMSGRFPQLAAGTGSKVGGGALLAFLFEGDENGAAGFSRLLEGMAVRLGADIGSDEAAQRVFGKRFTDVAGEAKTVVLSGEVLIGLDRLAEFTKILEGVGGQEMLVDTQVVDRRLALVVTSYLTDRGDLPGVVRDVPLTVRTSLAAIGVGGRPYGLGIWNSPFSKSVLGQERKHLEMIKNDTDRLRILNPGKFFSLTTGSGLPVWGWTYRIGLSMAGVFGEGGVK
jgi:FAD/FMN-containing dehydrogenase